MRVRIPIAAFIMKTGRDRVMKARAKERDRARDGYMMDSWMDR